MITTTIDTHPPLTMLGRPLTAAAGDGDPLILGQNNEADTETQLIGHLIVQSIYAAGEQAQPGGAVTGFGFGSLGSAGVVGDAEDLGAIGVLAMHANHGTALRVLGKTQFPDRSGRATVPGRQSVGGRRPTRREWRSVRRLCVSPI